MYTASEISKYVISKCKTDEKPISNLQLQKILYYIQRHFLQECKTPAFADEIQAWRFGPVVPNVYYEYCFFGSMPITIDAENIPEIQSCDKLIIDNIVNDKRELNPWDLVEDTHRVNGAWYKAYKNGLGDKSEIPITDIEKLG